MAKEKTKREKLEHIFEAIVDVNEQIEKLYFKRENIIKGGQLFTKRSFEDFALLYVNWHLKQNK